MPMTQGSATIPRMSTEPAWQKVEGGKEPIHLDADVRPFQAYTFQVTDSGYDFAASDGYFVVIQTDGAVRWTDDGTAPTESHGNVLQAGGSMTYVGEGDLRFIGIPKEPAYVDPEDPEEPVGVIEEAVEPEEPIYPTITVTWFKTTVKETPKAKDQKAPAKEEVINPGGESPVRALYVGGKVTAMEDLPDWACVPVRKVEGAFDCYGHQIWEPTPVRQEETNEATAMSDVTPAGPEYIPVGDPRVKGPETEEVESKGMTLTEAVAELGSTAFGSNYIRRSVWAVGRGTQFTPIGAFCKRGTTEPWVFLGEDFTATDWKVEGN